MRIIATTDSSKETNEPVNASTSKWSDSNGARHDFRPQCKFRLHGFSL